MSPKAHSFKPAASDR